jgi:hypothetical protein
MAWDSIEDLWWLKPGPEQVPPLQALQAGAAIAQNNARLQLQRQELTNSTVRTEIDLAEHRNKMALQNKVAVGFAKLAGALSETSDYTDPSARMKIFSIAKEHPEIMSSPAWSGVEKMFDNADALENKIEIQRMKDIQAQQQTALKESSLQRRLDIMQQRADTYGEYSEARVRVQDALQSFREANAATTHSERARKLDIAQQMADLADQRLTLDYQREARLGEESAARAKAIEGKLSDADKIGMMREMQTAHDIFLAVPRASVDEWNLAQQDYKARIGTIVRKYEAKTSGAKPGTAPGAAPAPQAAPAVPGGVLRFDPLQRRVIVPGTTEEGTPQ